jgi:hypothetical protein
MSDESATGASIRVRCTACGFIGPLNDFDVMGADKDKLFCNECGNEAPVERASEETTFSTSTIMSKQTSKPEDRALREGRWLIGRRIVRLRYLTESECRSAMFTQRCVVLELDDGTLLSPQADDEGNEAGVLIAQRPDGSETMFYLVQ